MGHAITIGLQYFHWRNVFLSTMGCEIILPIEVNSWREDIMHPPQKFGVCCWQKLSNAFEANCFHTFIWTQRLIFTTVLKRKPRVNRQSDALLSAQRDELPQWGSVQLIFLNGNDAVPVKRNDHQAPAFLFVSPLKSAPLTKDDLEYPVSPLSP
ncbi:MAG: hypothetical protein OJF49_001877 [Ktedonobacterales bacterium]|nr:MAG: hypothetical protein OJF49_001877 [Ktedonobacterales bacterium]